MKRSQRCDLARRVDRITRADRKFFERHPHRRHRVRAAGRGEFDHVALAVGKAAGARLRARSDLQPSRMLRPAGGFARSFTETGIWMLMIYPSSLHDVSH